jgi:hypothetical protein
MDKKELKKIVKQMVQESIAEVFLQLNLETLIEGAIKRTMKQQQPSRVIKTESPATLVESKKSAPREEIRSKIKQLVSPDESEWASIYEDTAKHGSPILEGEDGSDRPELVPESLLQESGLLRDFSKFVK